MADLNVIAKEICRSKNLDKNLSAYISSMMTSYSRFSYIKFSMNYYTFCDVLREEGKDSKTAKEPKELLAKLDGMIEENIVNNAEGDEPKAAIESLMKLRQSVMDTMEIVTAYVDRFSVMEHVLNRVEFRFSDEPLDDDYYENGLLGDIMNYILSDRDSVVMNSRIAEVVGQIPVRLTKTKFFELVKEAFGLYKGQEKTSVKDFVYMLDTVSGIYEPSGFTERFPDLYEILTRLSGMNYKEISKEEFDRASRELAYAVSYLTKTGDLYVQMMELINDMAVILLAAPSAFHDQTEIANSIAIIRAVMNRDGADSDGDEFLSDITDRFIFFEGKQEKIYSQISTYDYVIDEIEKAFAQELSKNGLSDSFSDLKKIAKLSSGSHFVSLEETAEDRSIAGEQDVEELFSAYQQKMTAGFAQGSQMMNRAVMSAVLASLPVFFNNVNEIMTFVKTSLEQCSDAAEKKACVSLMRMLIEDSTRKG